MRWFVIFLTKAFLTCVVLSKGLYRAPHTITKVLPSMVTSWVPSSCVHVDENLPLCRTGRFLNFFNKEENSTETPTKEKMEPELQTTTPGWGEYFGIFAPTVTVTKVNTTYLPDPKIVVTYSIQGCRPTKLAVDFNRCSDTVNTIVPTSTLLPTTKSTASEAENFNQVDVEKISAYKMLNTGSNQVNNYLEASNEGINDEENDKQFEATDPLFI